ncbi:hypothetical protein [Methylobacterium haplocladii]|uniref:Peptidase inhibitor family I36 protein n=1 Tax=Methylobacterium haplocladii TaxID=1176176 RepID=A0A512IQ48_9HYPH|nr:hypothetical protein [Methylobacterium haplocladii]GEO99748.1 hypothetical protein MHA02_21360 [Methylobacterium haplocladii]GLS60141.1 hypothetical protein GCM10007887_28190 [Methylobacterium haplocladii]
MAREIGDDEPVPRLDAPMSPVADVDGHRPVRLTIPLLLAAGWGALLTFSVMFLLEDGRGQMAGHLAAAERTAVADQSDAERIAMVRARRQATAEVVTTGDTGVIAEEAAVGPAGVIRVASVAPEPLTPVAPVAPVRPPSPAIERVNYVGTWGPTAQACGATSRRRGYLPALITEDGAKAGRTLCRFRNGRRDGIAWTVAADCSERGRRWTSQVRLLVDGDHLTWTSAKGASTYVRCGRRDG